MKLTPADFEKLETKELANIIRKLSSGKTLTKREEEKLQRAKLGANEQETNFVQTWYELARVLTQRIGVSVSRKSLQNWRNERIRPDLEPKWPRDRADGRKDISAWVKFVVENGLNRADEVFEGDKLGDENRKTVRDWKMYREELACQESERRIARGDNLLLVAADLEIPIGSMLAAINSKLTLYPPRAARFMVMKRDVADAEQTLRDEMDAVVKDLNLAEYIEQSIAEIISAFPFNDEVAALYAKVSFDGHDRAGFVELIRLSVEETLRRIGKRALNHDSGAAAGAAASQELGVTPTPSPIPTTSNEDNPPPNESDIVTRPRKRGRAKGKLSKSD